MSVERFLTGKPETVRKLNLLVDAIKSLQSLNGDIFIRAANTSIGTTVRLNFPAVLERIMKNYRPFRHGYSLGFHGGGSSLPVANETLTTIPIDFTTSDPDSWLASDGFVVPYDGIYFASAAFYVAYGIHIDTVAYVIGRNVTGAVDLLKSVPEVTLSINALPFAMLFHINGMVELEQGDLFQYMFWHEAGGGNTMEMGNATGAHAGLWLIERM